MLMSLQELKEVAKHDQKEYESKSAELDLKKALVGGPEFKKALRQSTSEKDNIQKQFKAFRKESGVTKRKLQNLSKKLILSLKAHDVDVSDFEEEFRKVEEEDDSKIEIAESS